MKRKAFLFLLLLIAVSGVSIAQFRRGWNRNVDISVDRQGVPSWEVDRNFPSDLFTFVRIQYDSYYGRAGGAGWRTDYPDSDLNFSLRLQQLTSMNVDPNPIIRRLTDADLVDYPFIYIIEPGSLIFSDDEVAALRRYCLNGGFLMVDDFWGDSQYENMRYQLSRVFPDRQPFELPLSHEIFHNVYDLKEKPQVPALSQYAHQRSWEIARDGSDTSQANYRAITDDQDRIMVLICHNTDLGDGWEREAEDQTYFQEFSVKKAYPMGINIVTYAMTH